MRETNKMDKLILNGQNIDLSPDYQNIRNKPKINGVTVDGNKTLDDFGVATKQEVENVSEKVAKLPYGMYYGQYDDTESLPDVSLLTQRGYAYVATTEPNIFYIYTYDGEGDGWQDSGNKFDAGSLESNLSTKSQTKAPTTKAVKEGIDAVNLLEAKTSTTELTRVQKYQASANINDRAADVDQQTSEVKALGYKVLKKYDSNDASSTFAAQVTAANTVYEIRDEFDLSVNDEQITIACENEVIASGQTVFISADSIISSNNREILLTSENEMLVKKTVSVDEQQVETITYTIEATSPSRTYGGTYYIGRTTSGYVTYSINVRKGIPANSILKFNGGKLKNGAIGSATNSALNIIADNYEIFDNIALVGKCKNTIQTSWFGSLRKCLESITRLNTSNEDALLNIEVDTKDNYDKTLVINRNRTTINFKREVTTTINDGTAILQIGRSENSSTIGSLVIENFKIRYSSGYSSQQDCIGILISGKNSSVVIKEPRIYYVKYGIIFAAPSTYLSSIIMADISQCTTGVWIKQVNSSDWQNGLFCSFRNLINCTTGFLAEHGSKNTIDCTCTEIGGNDVGINIKGGTYTINGCQWNELSTQNCIKVEENGFVRLTGMTGIDTPQNMLVKDNGVIYEDKGQDIYPVATIVDKSNLVVDLKMYNDGSNGIIENAVNRQRNLIEYGHIINFGFNSPSFVEDEAHSGKYYPHGETKYYSFPSFTLENGFSTIVRYFTERVEATTSLPIQLYFRPSSVHDDGEGASHYYFLTVGCNIESVEVKITRVDILNGTNTNTYFAYSYSSYADRRRLGTHVVAITFDKNGLKTPYRHTGGSLTKVDGVTQETFDEYINEVKSVEFNLFRFQMSSYDASIPNIYLGNILIFNTLVKYRYLRTFAEQDNVEKHSINTFGATAPTANLVREGGVGRQFFYTTINAPIWYDGTQWVNYRGNKYGNIKGNHKQRPASLSSNDQGYDFWDTQYKEHDTWEGTKWVKYNGDDVIDGTRETAGDGRPYGDSCWKGYQLFDKTLGTSGLLIICSSNNSSASTWKYPDGTNVSA